MRILLLLAIVLAGCGGSVVVEPERDTKPDEPAVCTTSRDCPNGQQCTADWSSGKTWLGTCEAKP